MSSREEIIVVGPKHPAWSALHDDDWNGHTLSNWLGTIRGKRVRIEPAEGVSRSLLQELWTVIASNAGYVEVKGSPVHVLKHGSPVCGIPGTPNEWPKGHIWVSFEEPNLGAVVTCAKCREAQGLPEVRE